MVMLILCTLWAISCNLVYPCTAATVCLKYHERFRLAMVRKIKKNNNYSDLSFIFISPPKKLC